MSRAIDNSRVIEGLMRLTMNSKVQVCNKEQKQETATNVSEARANQFVKDHRQTVSSQN
jgi:hypothetical protein